MQIIKPIVHETVWGGEKLTPVSGSDCKKIGHLYSCIDTKKMCSEISWGTYAGKTIHDWFIDNRDKYGWSKYEELPVLMALVEAADNLSIQVHPDDEMAAKLENKPFGKNESFFIIEPPTAGRMYNGCKVSTEELDALFADGKCLDGVDTVEVKAGDYVYVTGGTLHAAARGSLSFEIEENCDATFRFYDFDRLDKNGQKRPLQVENALACLRPEKRSKISRYEEGKAIVERMYSTELITKRAEYVNDDTTIAIAVLLKGEKVVEGQKLLAGAAVLLELGDKLDMTDCQWMLIKILAK